MHFRCETQFAGCSAPNRCFLSPFAPIILQFGADLRHRRFWRGNKIAPSPIIAGLEAIQICIPSVTFAALKYSFYT